MKFMHEDLLSIMESIGCKNPNFLKIFFAGRRLDANTSIAAKHGNLTRSIAITGAFARQIDVRMVIISRFLGWNPTIEGPGNHPT